MIWLAWSENDGSIFELADYFDRYVPCFWFSNRTYLALSSKVSFIQVEGQQHCLKNGFGGVTVLFQWNFPFTEIFDIRCSSNMSRECVHLVGSEPTLYKSKILFAWNRAYILGIIVVALCQHTMQWYGSLFWKILNHLFADSHEQFILISCSSESFTCNLYALLFQPFDNRYYSIIISTW